MNLRSMTGRARIGVDFQPPEVLFVHQSADLYGSDRVLLFLVSRLQRETYRPVVLLPEYGPLHQALVAQGVETHVVPVAKISRATLSVGGMLSVPFQLAKSLLRIRKVLAGRNIRLVYSNTLAVLSGAICAKWYRIPHLWHVHELIVSPDTAKKTFPFLLRVSSTRVICNSAQTRNWIVGEQPALDGRSVTIHNGIERDSEAEPASAREFRRRVGADREDHLVVTLVGRINRMKGQLLLVEAAEILRSRGYQNLRYVIVGSPPHGQEHFLSGLMARVEISTAKEAITLLGYIDGVWPVWDGSDIAVVPSVEPESFGLVAIEAMAAGTPVVASAHGGLLDIIEHESSGLLVTPGSAMKLAEAIARLADDKEFRLQLGSAGKLRQVQLFSLSKQLDRLVGQIDSLVLQ